jgi:hypothetical protein
MFVLVGIKSTLSEDTRGHFTFGLLDRHVKELGCHRLALI